MVAVATESGNIASLIPHANLPAYAKLIMLMMLIWADPETCEIGPESHRSLAEIGAACNVSKSTVIRMLGILERTGWMKRTIPTHQQKALGETAGYRFLIPGVQETPATPEGPSRCLPGTCQAELFTVVPPTGVLPGSTDVPPTAGTSVDQDQNPIRASRDRSKSGIDLTSATDKRAGVSGQNAGSVVAAYIDSYKMTWDSTPMQLIIKRIGRDAKLLLTQGIAFETVMDAARELGTTEYANLTTTTHRLVTRRENDPRYTNQSWLKVRTVAPFSSEVGSWDAVGTWGRETAVAPDIHDAVAPNWDATVRWHAGDDGDDYHGYDGADADDDEVREAYL